MNPTSILAGYSQLLQARPCQIYIIYPIQMDGGTREVYADESTGSKDLHTLHIRKWYTTWCIVGNPNPLSSISFPRSYFFFHFSGCLINFSRNGSRSHVAVQPGTTTNHFDGRLSCSIQGNGIGWHRCCGSRRCGYHGYLALATAMCQSESWDTFRVWRMGCAELRPLLCPPTVPEMLTVSMVFILQGLPLLYFIYSLLMCI